MVKASLARRLGNGGGGGIKGDARLKIMKAKQGKNLDARDMLANKNRILDARQQLQKIKNLKEGKLDVKQVGGVTITKKLNGRIELTTKKKKQDGNADLKKVEAKKYQIGNFTKTVLSSGKVSLSTKKETATGGGLRSRPAVSVNGRGPSGDRGGGGRESPQTGIRPERGRIGLTEYERMDEELMRSSVDKAEYDRIRRKTSSAATITRTAVPTARGRSPLPVRSRSPISRRRSRSPIMRRSRSPVDRRSRSPQAARSRSNGHQRDEWRRGASPVDRRGGGRIDYDTPRDETQEEDLLRRRVASKTSEYDNSDNYTMASRRDQVNTVSPLQGSKIVLSNLQTSVTYEDIVELFGDVGALRRVRVNTPGQAEVTFVNHEDAEKAVEIYHNRQLDGKPMKCTLTTTSTAAMKHAYKLPASLTNNKSGNTPAPDLNLIHKALFLNKKQAAGRKQSFTITMPKKGKDEPDYFD